MFAFVIIFIFFGLDKSNAALNCTCGQPGVSSSRIVNGVETGKNEFPWIAAVRIKTSPLATIPNLPYCSGSLVSDRFVLTAAHCLAKLRNEDSWRRSELVFGMHWARSDPPEVQLRNIKRAVMKVQYQDTNKDYDVALLELDVPVEINKVIYPICLPYNLK
ncbi:serine protease 27-like [Pollicipes pollicipes]|nr:serine protease 27-like [Pollicipes pollicipes]